MIHVRLDLRHWMVGFTFDRYNILVSIGPLNVVFVNNNRYKRDMEKHILENGGKE